MGMRVLICYDISEPGPGDRAAAAEVFEELNFFGFTRKGLRLELPEGCVYGEFGEELSAAEIEDGFTRMFERNGLGLSHLVVAIVDDLAVRGPQLVDDI